MQPKPQSSDQGDLFRSRLDQMLDRQHELYRLADQIDLFDHLTGFNITYTEDWADKCILKGRLNKHRFDNDNFIETLPNWKIDIIKTIITPQSWSIYTSLGYKKPDFL